MSMHTAGDIPLLVTSENSSSERRINPSWTIGLLKAKLEPVTGIPPLSQKLVLNLGSGQAIPIEASDEENTQLAIFSLTPYAEIHVRQKFSLVALPNIFPHELRLALYVSETWPKHLPVMRYKALPRSETYIVSWVFI
jgi:hypothetical protein